MVAAVGKKKIGRKELRVDPDWLAAVQAEAERRGLSFAAYVRLAVFEKMERDRRRQRDEREED